MKQKTRAAVLQRDDWRCQDCGIGVGTAEDNIPTAEVHHIDRESDDSLDNLETLCPNCHSLKPGRDLSGRPETEPSEGDVLNAMTPCEPYTASELVDLFGADVSRWTIQRRLESLNEDGLVRRKKHAENRVTWWIEEKSDPIRGATDGSTHDDALACPDCGKSFETFDELREHMEATEPDHGPETA